MSLFKSFIFIDIVGVTECFFSRRLLRRSDRSFIFNEMAFPKKPLTASNSFIFCNIVGYLGPAS